MKDCNFKVYIYCASFNHSRYIKDALDGFCMQQTDFPYVCAIKDDASTDGEPDIIRKYIEDNFETSDDVFYTEETEYANIIFARHKTNKNCFIAAVLLKYNHYSIKKSVEPYFERWRKGASYISLCEGDDCWTDSLKLQKQVDYLESHPDYSMCFHNAVEHWEDGRVEDRLFSDVEDREYTGEEIFKKWTVPTASILYRTEIQKSDLYRKACQNKKFIYGDIVLFLTCAHYGKLYGMSDVMSVYRKQPGGAVYNYNAERQKKQAYHELEMYKIFGDRYKDISIQRFSKSAMEAFWGLKANGKIDLKLLLDIAIYSPSTLLHEIIKRIKG